jgi:ribA/ribD-fused uncharacterized protein
VKDGIYGFFNEFRFLSNFELCPVEYEGQIYPSSEAAYQAAKTTNPFCRKLFQEAISDDHMVMGRHVRNLGRKQFRLRPDWDDVRLKVMEDVVWDKFTRNSHLRDALLLTGDLHLEETNTWNDTFWGVCQGKGENNLGKILMDVRRRLREDV